MSCANTVDAASLSAPSICRKTSKKSPHSPRPKSSICSIALDEQGAVAQEYQANAIPMLVLIDKAGIVRFVHVGLRSDLKAALHSEIDQLLATKAAAVDTSRQPELK